MDRHPVCVIGQGDWAAKLADMLTESGFLVRSCSSEAEAKAVVSQAEALCLVIDLADSGGGNAGKRCPVPLCELPRDQPMVVVMTDHDEALSVTTVAGGGVDYGRGYHIGEMVSARLRSIFEDHGHADQFEEQYASVTRRRDRLTPREKQVMDLVVQGRLNKQIAADLGLSHKTIEVHRAHVMEKMQCRSLAELVRSAVLLEHNEGMLPVG